jgi:type I restriction enzyme M protein
MFRRLKINRFRSIESAEVEFGKFTVVVGPNGSGKSNFVDALVFLRDLARDGEAAVSSRGGIGSVVRKSKTKPFDLGIDLRVAPSKEELDSDFLEHALWIRPQKEGWRFLTENLRSARAGNVQDLIERSENGVERWGLGSAPPTIHERASALHLARAFDLIDASFRAAVYGVHRYRINPEFMRAPLVATGLSRLMESGANMTSAIHQLHGSRGLEAVVATMSKVIPGLRDIRVGEVGGYEVLLFDQAFGGGSTTFSAREVSEGALRALGVVVAAQQMQPGELLIVEEPEANVHPGAAALIYDVLEHASQRCDVLVTTHSPDLLDAAKDETILVCDYVDGATRIGPLAETQRQLVRDGLFRLAELMRSEPLRIEGDEPESIRS